MHCIELLALDSHGVEHYEPKSDAHMGDTTGRHSNDESNVILLIEDHKKFEVRS